MVFSLFKWKQRFKYVVFFVALTYALYRVLAVVAAWAEPQPNYDPPAGRAVKAIQHEAVAEERVPLKDRLLLFYRYGE